MNYPSEEQAETQWRQAQYGGYRDTLIQISLSNSMLNLVTLGFFRFWAKTRLRRYLWSRLRFLGDPVHYTGNGVEMFVGFLIAITFILPMALIFEYAKFTIEDQTRVSLLTSLYLALFVFLFQIAVYRSRRYKLTRTSWRCIHFNQDGSAVIYALRAMGWLVIHTLTLGLSYGFGRVNLQRFRTNHSLFGDQRMALDAKSWSPGLRWACCLLLTLPTFGFSIMYYFVWEFRYFARQTRIGKIRFESDLGFWPVVTIMSVYSLSWTVLATVAITVMASLVWDDIALVVASGLIDELLILSIVEILIDHVIEFVVVLLFATMIHGMLKTVFYVHPIIGAITTSTTVVASDRDIELIGQADAAGLAGGEGLADAFDLGSV